ncbi:MAG: methyltransferase domain-containing protein [Bacteroidetes bacterium]|nr:methyltransferase domain-containing protein [Bacteroidota bacterium]
MSDERLYSHKPSPWLGEHLHRYQVAISYLKEGTQVLDIATGEGYGAAMLAQAEPASRIIAVDAEAESIAACRSKYRGVENLHFQQEDATRLSFPDNHFDLIVSFETLEHVPDYTAMLRELNRVLKPDGLLLLSTPNFPVNSPTGKILNPYHVKEFTLEEMEQLLPQALGNVYIMGQQYARWHKRTGVGKVIGQATERFFYQRGVRKLSLGFRDACMKLIAGTPLYPLPKDYRIVPDKADIRQCKTFFVTAQKKG